MTLFEESHWRPSQTQSAEQVAYYRKVLTTHAKDPATGKCRLCHVTGCPDWRSAYDHLATAGELMAEPEQWLNVADAGQPAHPSAATEMTWRGRRSPTTGKAPDSAPPDH